ncbi:1,4-dihydroxy-2-naphthoate octaprenyltransferase [Plebeiibacterium marinum]|uniref:1,4-dihydroxy-2-naphthoate octaprenyltransferase n=1 Tax=Plebeiibacterium marinum TaxID=2992111 RepID=A0AAE3MDE6_9BACT|nr:1,4-dihydroxy-2-naphthoate octaprenyltransferase [Plebeiobacterium marinum]MCW3805893.1 1,4-dihydroxy-2-naphthoate octaprenyltransferase [Plebeiobacterium marinum]
MSKIKSYISSFRLRTLPLAVSTVLMGNFLASYDGNYNEAVGFLAILTTIFLQILSNVANDYGDAVSGADNMERVGPERMVASGKISMKEMKLTVIVFAFLSLVSGVTLIVFADFEAISLKSWLFLLLGMASIVAAIKYTVGKNPYGYRGMGDLFVFVFFGLVGVLGTYFLHVGTLNFWLLLPATTVGLLSVGVLNLNNLRDVDSDAKSGKRTLVVIKGSSWGKKYHLFLIVGSMLLFVIYGLVCFESIWRWFFIPVYILLVKDLVFVYKNQDPSNLYPYLKKLALATFFLVLLSGVALCI